MEEKKLAITGYVHSLDEVPLGIWAIDAEMHSWNGARQFHYRIDSYTSVGFEAIEEGGYSIPGDRIILFYESDKGRTSLHYNALTRKFDGRLPLPEKYPLLLDMCKRFIEVFPTLQEVFAEDTMIVPSYMAIASLINRIINPIGSPESPQFAPAVISNEVHVADGKKITMGEAVKTAIGDLEKLLSNLKN